MRNARALFERLSEILYCHSTPSTLGTQDKFWAAVEYIARVMRMGLRASLWRVCTHIPHPIAKSSLMRYQQSDGYGHGSSDT